MREILEYIITIMQFGFFQRAFIALLIVSIIAPFIGMFLVTKQGSNLADGISHITILGVTMGLFFGLNISIISLFVSIFSAILLEYLNSTKKISLDAGIVLMVSISLAFVSIFQRLGVNSQLIEGLLFGNILSVSWSEIRIISLIAVISCMWTIAHYRSILTVISFGEQSKIVGISYMYINYTLMAVVGAVIYATVQATGGLLASGMLIIPVLIAQTINRGFLLTHSIAVLASLVSAVFGLFVSIVWDIPVSSAVIISLVILLILCSIFAQMKRKFFN